MRAAMAESLAPQERLQPALLDRLTDDEPEKTRETREARVMTRAQLRRAVLRDLAWLFNSTRLESSTNADLSVAPYARRSVINFGLPPLSGETASTLDLARLERGVRQSILDFEPRILPNTLRVRAVVEERVLDQHNVIGVEIHGFLWAQPTPLELLLRTEIDLETGHVHLLDLAARGA